MARKCCLYEQANGTRYRICTTDDACPEMAGDTFVGSWGVGDCDECLQGGDKGLDLPKIEVELLVDGLRDAIVRLQRFLELMERYGQDPRKPPEL